MKYFRLTMDAILWEYSFVNIVMIQAAIPAFEELDEEDKREEEEEIEVTSVMDLAQFIKV